MMTADEARLYVATSLLPAMGIAGRSFDLEAPSGAGTRSTIHRVLIDGFPALLMRTFPYRRQAAGNVSVLRHLESLSLPAPRLVFHDVQIRPRLADVWEHRELFGPGDPRYLRAMDRMRCGFAGMPIGGAP